MHSTTLIKLKIDDDYFSASAEYKTQRLDSELSPAHERKKTEEDSKSTVPLFFDSREATQFLIQSIKAHDAKSVTQAIQSDAEINIIHTDEDGSYTPLEFAVTRFDYKITQILLENGADPNFKSNESSSLINLLIDSVIEMHKDAPPKKIPIKFKSLMEIIDTAHQILDLLLCYGLKPEFQLSKDLIEFTDIIKNRRERAIGLVVEADIFRNEFDLLVKSKNIIFKKVIGPACTTIYSWIHNSKAKKLQTNLGQLPNLSAPLPSIPKIISEASEQIKKRKVEKKDDRLAILKTVNTNLYICLLKIIMEYDDQDDRSEEIAKERKNSKHMIQIWNPNQDYKIEDQAQINIVAKLNRFMREIGLEQNLLGFLKGEKKPLEIIFDYLNDEEKDEHTKGRKP